MVLGKWDVILGFYPYLYVNGYNLGTLIFNYRVEYQLISSLCVENCVIENQLVAMIAVVASCATDVYSFSYFCKDNAFFKMVKEKCSLFINCRKTV